MSKKEIIEKIITKSVDKIMEERFETYSKYVISNRAIPDVRDGLKPVHRRILYSMYTLGLDFDKKFKKSARIVGDVIGKYHPHGDTSVYDAMINLAQWWKMNIPLLSMHGNIGSIDDDKQAAMRYTEVKLAKIANYIIGDIKKKTVKFIPNFDDSETEPIVLPSMFPNLLVNGSRGIAIGMATEMPPHNLGEIIDACVYKIKHPKASYSELSNFVLGPDFPTGGVIKGTKGIAEALENGRNEKNKIKLFCKYEIYTKGKNKFIEITEIPYGVVKVKLVYEIDLIIQNKLIDGIIEIKDRSDRDGINILITLDINSNEESILNYLFSKTQMQITYSYNNIVIDNNSPTLMNLENLISSYIAHIKNVKTLSLNYDLNKAKVRLEIINGFIKVSEITSQVIELIRKTQGSKMGVVNNLIQAFNFTKLQAESIAELRLYKLSQTDKEIYLKEKVEVEETINIIENLLNNEKEFNNFLINEIKTIKKEFSVPRKTQIEKKDFEVSYNKLDLVKEEIINVSISKNGFIKRFSDKVLENNEWKNYALKEKDNLVFFSKVNTVNFLLCFTNLGNYVIVPIYQIQEVKWKDLGNNINLFASDIRPDEEIVSVIEVSDFEENLSVMLGTKQGYFKRVMLKDFLVSRFTKKYTAMPLNEDDYLIKAKLTNLDSYLVAITENSIISKFSESEIMFYSTKARGSKAIYFSVGDKLSNFTIASYGDEIFALSSDLNYFYFNEADIVLTPKNIKGRNIFDKKYKLQNKNYLLFEDALATDFLYFKNTLNELNQVKLNHLDKKKSVVLKYKFDNFESVSLIKSLKKETINNSSKPKENPAQEEKQEPEKEVVVGRKKPVEIQGSLKDLLTDYEEFTK
ncbi:DNA topoisomerase IV subunit A [Mycoplasmopsis synoviae]|uniref:DNA topoisomerase IV subunit A n=1 Tax=Mycoplasmopsis synoviae TaxID=2109 RepID=UPI000CA3A6D9|nr:DNA topoisomerase IV subunit A [Mycoplasmopsis synoviae]AKJ20983.1 Topoisomerase IV subunit A [Mycoplasmopsis synoviae]AWL83897.1 DNA topoisomerase IV [Mycoplasmopsis synoviae]UZF64381.1 DNA topoisomerase IV subunit A [Mycoplasmopsis synoviae]UZF65052.1 DNA topoisomerase IV subunit A [Mycoplasmopsis synoviae]UZF65725.1 DNA topoisomerase IV subunit A [Mycoplasmopsis synoviae]